MAKAKRARSLPHGDVRALTIKVKADPKRVDRYRKLLAQIETARREESSGFDAYWEAVGEVLDAGLHVEGAYDTPEAWVRAIVKEPMRTVRRMVRVAKYASPVEEARWGTTLLDAALGYIEALTGGPLKSRLPIELESLRIPVIRDGAPKKVPLDDVQIPEVLAATKKLLRPKDPVRSPSEAVIAGELASISSLATATVHVSEGVLRLGGVPIAALAHLGQALVKAAAKIGDAGAAKKKKPAASKKPARRR